jgi:predicted amidohydrolase YtcJ
MGAMSLVGVLLSRDASLVEMQAEIRRYASEHPNRRWIIGRGWHYSAFPGGMPTRGELDEAIADRPAFMRSFDGHSAWANTRALEIAAITGDTPDPPRGVIVRDATGEPTGAFKEDSAAELVDRHAPPPPDDELLAGLRAALRNYGEQGLTSGQDAWSYPDDFAPFARLARNGELTARFRLALMLDPELDAAQWERRLEEYEAVAFPRRGDPWLSGGILKGFADGVVETGTAYLIEPYTDRPGCGVANWTDEQLAEAVAIAHRRGWQVQLHAIGDGAVRQVLDAYESLGTGEARARRHRLEHIETIDSADIPRVGTLGVVASVQPYHSDPVGDELALWSTALGPDRASRGWPFASIRSHGAVLAFGSDWFVRPFEPFLALNAAVNRTTVDGEPRGGWLPHERIGLAEALTAYTWGSAYAAHEEGRRGRLAPGYFADVCVLDRDLLAEGPSAIVGTRVGLTVVGGRVVHRTM